MLEKDTVESGALIGHLNAEALRWPKEHAGVAWSTKAWTYTGTTPGSRAIARIGEVGRIPTPGRAPQGPEAPPTGAERTFFVAATEASDIEALPDFPVRHVTNLRRANDADDLNALFRAVNARLPVGGTYTGCVETCGQVKRRHFSERSRLLAWPAYVLYFLYRRVLPKLALTRGLYRWLARGRGHAISKTEILGRLVYCGFEVLEHWVAGNELHFIAEKRGLPSEAPPPASGFVFAMERVGRGGQIRSFYKLRTMHPYAEYLQANLYATNALASNGKFNNDFRITSWGRFMRKTWLDEVPMLLNLLKGDLKLVGVRPLSRHYLSLYPAELLELRLRHKPGLVPPFYADLPSGFEAICESERRYLEAYERHPVRTDIRYFVRAMWRILIERARSQ
ncbi:MAG: sugar transferase [Rubricoccaceae bacterium]|nr:sugar transferase [Rubricoccaceae bacterium]